MHDATVKQRFAELGTEPVADNLATPEALRAHLKAEIEKWAPIIMELGMVTPPVGLNLYVASELAKMGLTEVTIAAAPWLIVMVAYLLLITYVPSIATWLPNLLCAR